MQITVCVAVTPATDTRIAIAPDGRGIAAADVKYELNPYDEFALEEGLRIVEKLGQGEVHLVTVGAGREREELRKGLARGAHTATILKADPDAADSAGVAKALAERIKANGSTIALLGKQAVDGDNAQVPSRLAVALDWPVVNKVSKLEIDGDAFRAEREIEGGIEVVTGKLPAVFSAEKGLNEPRFPSLKGIMAAKKKPLEEIDTKLAEPLLIQKALELPAPRAAGKMLGEGAAAVPALVKALRDEARVI